jgi:hypothetical protein
MINGAGAFDQPQRGRVTSSVWGDTGPTYLESEMKLINLPTPKDRVSAEGELVEALKDAIYKYAGLLTVAQVIGCVQIALDEVWREQ